jgi:hypothetical protein
MTTQFPPTSTIVPKEITIQSEYIDNEKVEYHIAHFSYYDGTRYATSRKLRQTTKWYQLIDQTHFIVACGDVMVRIEPKDFPGIRRRRI